MKQDSRHCGGIAKVDSRNEAQSLNDSQAAGVADEKRNRILGFLKKQAHNAERYPLFCDEKPLLCERVQGRILGVCNCSTRDAIKGLSRKAESQKPTP